MNQANNTPSRLNSPSQDSRRVSSRRREHPDRLKVLIWNVKGQSIREVRLKYGIDTKLIMRERGVGAFKRHEIWCPSRILANTLVSEIKRKARRSDGHVSLGTSFSERKRKFKTNAIIASQANRLTIMHWNARSLQKKAGEVCKTLEDKRVKIACIQESSLPQDGTYHPKFKGFKIYHTPRENRKGGGLVTLVHESLFVESVDNNVTSKMEVAKLRVRISNNLAFTLYNVYVPGQGLRKEDLQNMLPVDEKTLIVGDFNSKHHTWNSGSSNGNGKAFYEWLLESNLVLVNENHAPTYQSASTGSLSSLDLTVATPSLWEKIEGWHVGQDLGSDHFPVFVQLDPGNLQTRNNSVVHSRYKMRSADWATFKDETLKRSMEATSKLDEIEEVIIRAADKSIPKQSGTAKRKHMNSWWNDNLQALRRARNNARKKWKKRKIPENRTNYNKCNALLRKAILEAKRGSWRDFVSSMDSNTPSSTVWKKFRAVNGATAKRINALTLPNGSLLLEDVAKAAAFSRFLADRSGNKVPWPQQLNHEEELLISRMEHLFSCSDPDDAPFSMEELTSSVGKLKRSSPGSDNIHNEMLKNCSPELLTEILGLFNDIWETGEIPLKWKTAKIIPLLKPGKDESKLVSYRPISLTSCLGKLMERLVSSRLTWRLESQNILDKHQFGFRPQRSTTDALLYFTNKIYEGFEGKKSTVAVLIDFEGAFDNIPHTTMILHCMKMGIKGKLLRFIVAFLEDRYIQTVVNDTSSSKQELENGIPQGGVICPSLFNIALYAISHELPPEVCSMLFADDQTIWATDSNHENATRAIQLALDAIGRWCLKWSLKISTQKTECAFFTRRNKLADYVPTLTLQGETVKYCKNPKLLGVVLDPKLRWSAHVEYVVKACTPRLNALKAVASRAWGADTSTLRMFYLAFVRSKAVYGCEVWGSAAKTHIHKVQAIQSSALRLCLGCTRTTAVAAMQVDLGVEPIELFIRRQMWTKFLKIKTLPTSHPLHNMCANHLGVKSSFSYQINLLSSMIPYNDPELIPPVYDEPPHGWPGIRMILDLPSKEGKNCHPDILKAETLKMLHEHYIRHTKIFTDGSLDTESGTSGAGYFNQTNGEVYFIPADAQSSMDVELLAINAALTSCFSIEAKDICILTDSKSSIEALSNPGPSAYFFRIGEIRKILLQLHREGKSITIQWVPSHCGVLGNETADRIAKEACTMYPTNLKKHSFLQCRSSSDRHFWNSWNDSWERETTGRTLFQVQPEPAREDVYKGVPRQVATFAARARTGHIVTQAYLARFSLTDSPLCQVCGSGEENLEHILIHCQYPIADRDILRTQVSGWQEILTNKKLWHIATNIYHGHRAIGYS